VIAASRLPWVANQQYICHLNEDVRACLNFYNKDPKAVALIAKKRALRLSSWRQAGW